MLPYWWQPGSGPLYLWVVHPCIRPILLNVIYQLHLERISSDLYKPFDPRMNQVDFGERWSNFKINVRQLLYFQYLFSPHLSDIGNYSDLHYTFILSSIVLAKYLKTSL